MRNALLVLTMMILGMPAHGDGLSDARAALAQSREELKAAQEAQTKGDAQVLSEHQAKAEEYLQRARTAFDAAQANDSNDPLVLQDYGDVLLQMGDSDLAAGAFRRLTQQTPDDPSAWFLLGRSLSLIGPGGSAESIKALNHALELDPASPKAVTTLSLLGKVYRREGLYDFARECAEKAIAIDPTHVGAQLALIISKIRDGQMAEAAADLDAMGAIPPGYAKSLPDLFGEAVNGYRDSRQVFADTAENHMAYAKILFHAGRVQSSLQAAERAATLGPNAYATWNLIGALSTQSGDTTRARTAYQRSLNIHPDQPRTREALDALDAPKPATIAE